ncbi:hypothetical protein BAUCODRAFT_134590 [Baudoinia panamericana UAMH 10762]|uniref:AB hydrolase-1 domain-containing protein n=1 Tax=Baudoinia panamericana (strain UAMH 10762) TaxID=717646 RepID=M2MYQ8_BAUPA|nr:uncharacterized protein BAUCODRAFT_134590 [Baudoinia panamericana UAMH 10762]EMC91809.1 hypothetical protein BAUCODRAFT_134590 [Baudoinia panamericana UAMH 10762]
MRRDIAVAVASMRRIHSITKVVRRAPSFRRSISPTKPYLLFVRGGGHSPEVRNTVRQCLRSSSYRSTVVARPSVGRATYDFTEDVDAIYSAAQGICDSGEDIILVLWSFSGVTGCEAVKALTRADRGAIRGAIVRNVIIAGCILPKGFQFVQRNDWDGFMEFMKPGSDPESGLCTVSPDMAKRVFYNDMSDADADAWAAKVKP